MTTINSKYAPLFHILTGQQTARYVYLSGGRASGKSFAVSNYTLRLSYKPGKVIVFLRYTMISAEISIVPEFIQAMRNEGIDQEFIIVGSEIINKVSGSKIIFKGVKTSSLNQTANLKSIQGLTDAVYDEFDEHPDQDSFDRLDNSIREANSKNTLVLSSNALHMKSWQYQQFFLKTGLYSHDTIHIHTTYQDNKENLSEDFLRKVDRVRFVDLRKYQTDFLGMHYEDAEGALWKSEWIQRVTELPEMKKIVVAIDPAVSAAKESDETGIIVVGAGFDGNYYVIEDKTDKYTPRRWAVEAVKAFDHHGANTIIAEKNQGGDLVESNIKTVDSSAPVKLVHASRGKVIRAEPVVSLYQDGKVYHKAGLSKLEAEMTSWNPGKDRWSPNRVDALVWGLFELGVRKRQGVVIGANGQVII